jgi:hypothetical protein
MRSRYKTVLVALVVVSAISAVAASSAFAEPQWETKSAGVWKPIASTLEVKATGELRLSSSETWGGATCKAETSGTIEPHGKGTITSFVLSACTSQSEACTNWRARRALHLSWKTELYLPEGQSAKARNRIVEGGSGQPQEEFECYFNTQELRPVCSLKTTQALSQEETGGGERETWERNEGVKCSIASHEEFSWWEGKLVIKPPTGTEAIRAK